jgi:hypothetical protein
VIGAMISPEATRHGHTADTAAVFRG